MRVGENTGADVLANRTSVSIQISNGVVPGVGHTSRSVTDHGVTTFWITPLYTGEIESITLEITDTEGAQSGLAWLMPPSVSAQVTRTNNKLTFVFDGGFYFVNNVIRGEIF